MNQFALNGRMPHPEEAASLARPSRRMAAGTILLVAVLGDARKSTLLRTSLMNDLDIIRATEMPNSPCAGYC